MSVRGRGVYVVATVRGNHVLAALIERMATLLECGSRQSARGLVAFRTNGGWGGNGDRSPVRGR